MSIEACLVLCRVIHYGSALVLFGASAYQAWLAPRPLASRLEPALRRFVLVAAAAGLVSALAWLGFAAGSMGEGWADVIDPDTLGEVLLDTGFGQVWQWHLGFGLTLLGVAFGSPRTSSALVAVLGGASLASLGLVGHAVMRQGAVGWIDRSSQILHLLAGGFWLGSLYPLALSLSRLQDADLRQEAVVALRRFSGLGHGAVALVIVTGAVNVGVILGASPLPPTSAYRVLLLGKMIVVALMVVLALVNRYVVVPRLRSSADALANLRAGVFAEGILGFVAIGLVSLFGTLPPE